MADPQNQPVRRVKILPMRDAPEGFLLYSSIVDEQPMIITNPIRVLIADDNDLTRSGLGVFLEAFDDLKLVGQAANGLEAIELCERVHPDVVLMDLVMPEMDGITATRAIRQSYPDIQVVVLTGFSGQGLAPGALRAGAAAFLLKNASIDELADAIRAARATGQHDSLPTQERK